MIELPVGENAKRAGFPMAETSALDEERFGVRTARATINRPQDTAELMAFCRAEAVRLLIVRCPTTNLATAHALESMGGRLMDVGLHLVHDFTKRLPLPEVTPVPIRSMKPSDRPRIAQIAAEAFEAYPGHYYADQRLERQKCAEVYISWADRLCTSRDPKVQTLVAELDGSVAGFIVFRLNGDEDAEGTLSGVAWAAQRRGIYHSLLGCNGPAPRTQFASMSPRISGMLPSRKSGPGWDSCCVTAT